MQSKSSKDPVVEAQLAYWLPAQRRIVNDLVREVERLRAELKEAQRLETLSPKVS